MSITVSLMPEPRIQFLNNSGTAPLAGGKVYTYQPGTTTPKATYTDSTGNTANANPVILDSNGMASIWLSGYYKISVTDSLGSVQPGYPVDNVSSMPSSGTTLSEWLTQSFAVTFVTGIASVGSSFSCPGDQTSVFVTGRRVQFFDVTTLYGNVVSSVYANPITTVKVVVDGTGVLSLGLTSVAVGLLMPTNQSQPYPQNRKVKEGDQVVISSDLSPVREGAAALTTAVVLSGTTTGTSTITGLSSTDGLSVGMLVTGTYIGAAPNRIVTIVSSTSVTLSGTTTAGTANITFTSSLYSLVGDQTMWYRSHNFPIDIHGCFGGRDEAGKGQLVVWTEGGISKSYSVASGAITIAPVASDFTLTRLIDLTTGAVSQPTACKDGIINGGALVAQRNGTDVIKNAAASTYVFGAPDRFTGAWSGSTCTAGSLLQDIAVYTDPFSVGRTRRSHHFSGVTLTGTGILYHRHRIEAINAKRFSGTCSLSVKVIHDIGSNVNFTLYLRKVNPTVDDVFTAVTEVANSGAISVPTNAATTLKLENVSMVDCVRGIEIEVKMEVGAITSKNVKLTEYQLEVGSVATNFEFEDYSETLRKCLRYYWDAQAMNGSHLILFSGYSIGGANMYTSFNFPVPMRGIPTVTKTGTWSATNCGQPTFSGVGSYGAWLVSTVTGTGAANVYATGGANVGLTASAEL